jgi:hypothetical protein
MPVSSKYGYAFGYHGLLDPPFKFCDAMGCN